MIQIKQLEEIRESHNLSKVAIVDMMRTSMDTYKRWLKYDDIDDMPEVTRNNYDLRLFFLMIQLGEFIPGDSVKGIVGTIKVSAVKKLVNWGKCYG